MTKRMPLAEQPEAIHLPTRLQFDWSNEEAIEKAMPTLLNLMQIMATIVDRARERREAKAESDAA